MFYCNLTIFPYVVFLPVMIRNRDTIKKKVTTQGVVAYSKKMLSWMLENMIEFVSSVARTKQISHPNPFLINEMKLMLICFY